VLDEALDAIAPIAYPPKPWRATTQRGGCGLISHRSRRTDQPRHGSELPAEGVAMPPPLCSTPMSTRARGPPLLANAPPSALSALLASSFPFSGFSASANGTPNGGLPLHRGPRLPPGATSGPSEDRGVACRSHWPVGNIGCNPHRSGSGSMLHGASGQHDLKGRDHHVLAAGAVAGAAGRASSRPTSVWSSTEQEKNIMEGEYFSIQAFDGTLS
jgi:hypothetical protein